MWGVGCGGWGVGCGQVERAPVPRGHQAARAWRSVRFPPQPPGLYSCGVWGSTPQPPIKGESPRQRRSSGKCKSKTRLRLLDAASGSRAGRAWNAPREPILYAPGIAAAGGGPADTRFRIGVPRERSGVGRAATAERVGMPPWRCPSAPKWYPAARNGGPEASGTPEWPEGMLSGGFVGSLGGAWGAPRALLGSSGGAFWSPGDRFLKTFGDPGRVLERKGATCWICNTLHTKTYLFHV